MRYRLRTLLILLAVGPPVVAGAWFGVWTIKRAIDNMANKPALQDRGDGLGWATPSRGPKPPGLEIPIQESQYSQETIRRAKTPATHNRP
jgi:hypothetical protein